METGKVIKWLKKEGDALTGRRHPGRGRDRQGRRRDRGVRRAACSGRSWSGRAAGAGGHADRGDRGRRRGHRQRAGAGGGAPAAPCRPRRRRPPARRAGAAAAGRRRPAAAQPGADPARGRRAARRSDRAPAAEPAAAARRRPQHGARPAPAAGVKASPLARKIAAQSGVDLKLIQGTGPGGRIVRRDVEAAAAAGGAAAGRRGAAAVRPAAHVRRRGVRGPAALARSRADHRASGCRSVEGPGARTSTSPREVAMDRAWDLREAAERARGAAQDLRQRPRAPRLRARALHASRGQRVLPGRGDPRVPPRPHRHRGGARRRAHHARPA